MEIKICSFTGHESICDEEKIKSKLKNEIVNLIENEGVITFYSGCKGAFDWLCATTVNELRKDYPFIKSYWILPYLNGKKDEYTFDMLKMFDNTIYPGIEKTPPRYAILKRNEWMIDKSDFLIAYVRYTWGGVYKTLEYGKSQKHISIKNIALK